MQATVAPFVSRTTRCVREVLLRKFCGNGIFTPAIRLMTVRTCSRSADCAEGRAAPNTSAIARVLIVVDMGILSAQAGTHGCPRRRGCAHRIVSPTPTNRCLASSREPELDQRQSSTDTVLRYFAPMMRQ